MTSLLHKPTLELLWPSYFAIGEVPITGLNFQHAFDHLARRPGEFTGDLPFDDSAQSALHTIIEKTIAELGYVSIPETLEIALWNGGFGMGLAQRTSAERELTLCLASSLKVEDRTHERSGALSFQDPRAGSHHVFVPGMPFGRPFVVPLAPRHFVISPGWVRRTVLPVAFNDARLVVRMDLY